MGKILVFVYIHKRRAEKRGVLLWTYRETVHGGKPLGASTNCKSLQATTFPRQAHSTGH